MSHPLREGRTSHHDRETHLPVLPRSHLPASHSSGEMDIYSLACFSGPESGPSLEIITGELPCRASLTQGMGTFYDGNLLTTACKDTGLCPGHIHTHPSGRWPVRLLTLDFSCEAEKKY